MSISVCTNRLRRCRFALAALLLAGVATGCVERRMTIRSNPPGAHVYVDDYDIGATPVSQSYIYYGTRRIRLVKDGYETLTVYQPMPPPWYGWPGIDFFSENLWPHEIRDERNFEYQMQPMVNVPTEELRARAEQLRTASQVVPAAVAQPIVGPPAINEPTVVAPQELPPPINSGAPTIPPGTATVPAPTYGPPMNAAPNSSPPLSATTLTPPGNYPPPGGYPSQSFPNSMPAPSPYSTPGTVPAPGSSPVPNFAPPGGAPSNAPGTPRQFGQPPVPPGWRPIGEVPTDTIQR
jgi:hypothetical protein